jgi:biotin carboxyl carrier protein
MKICVMIDDQSFEVEVGDLNARPILATVDGESFEVWPEENKNGSQEAAQAAVPVPAAAADIVTEAKPKAVLAPIPGVIIAVSVKVGDSISFGQELCTLEAMKMKNLIRASRSGKIGAIHVAVGDQVKHSQMLMEYTE